MRSKASCKKKKSEMSFANFITGEDGKPALVVAFPEGTPSDVMQKQIFEWVSKAQENDVVKRMREHDARQQAAMTSARTTSETSSKERQSTANK